MPKNARWVLLGVMLAMLLSMLDNMVVSTAMPTIVSDLGGLEHISWVVTAYTLVTAVTTCRPPSRRTASRYGTWAPP
ncbi:hypothetical protein HXP44_01430 [Streptomyces sioyaensis]|uniref:MFS transporter n=1 Tax=Streptomyces sioyaensis TaxID=67364 RepID=A0A4Q1R4N2_9ACTN|nr:hypothetical protein [Streptomyces sioyaensis]MBM4790757.1 hypothetical protein [Streptomyces sioyaensis]RXS67828.1 hypothetical protein EST54_10905 [Streptomyces sioyaensis]